MPAYPKTHQARRAKPLTVAEFKATTESEDVLQRQAEEYLDLIRLPFIRIPEEVTGLCSPTHPAKVSQHIKNMISKYFLGRADLILLDNESGKFLCVELKKKGGVQSTGQKRFERTVRDHYIIVRSFEEFEKRVTDFINERGTK